MSDNDVRIAVLETIALQTNQTLVRLENKMDNISREVVDVRKEIINQFRWILSTIILVVCSPYLSAGITFIKSKIGA